MTDLVLLPGLMCDHAFWQPLLDAAPPGQRCQVVDYGDAASITAMAQAALAVAPPQFALAGHSMGGRVALELVRLAPQRVRQLILMDTGYLPLATGEAGAKERAGREKLMDLALREGVRAMAAEWVKPMVAPARLSDAPLVESILAMLDRKTAARFVLQATALLTRPDGSAVLQALAGLNLPTLLLCGEHDGWASIAQHQAMQALAPQAALSVIADAGHMVLMEEPVPTIAAISHFLSNSLPLTPSPSPSGRGQG